MFLVLFLFSLHSKAQEATNETLSERSTLELEYEDLDDYDHSHEMDYGQPNYSNYGTSNQDYTPETVKPGTYAQSANYPQANSYQPQDGYQSAGYQPSVPSNSYQTNQAAGYQKPASANTYQAANGYQQSAPANNYQESHNKATYPGYAGTPNQAYGQGQTNHQSSASTYSAEKSSSYKQPASSTSSYVEPKTYNAPVVKANNYNGAQPTSGSQSKPSEYKQETKPVAYNTKPASKPTAAYNAGSPKETYAPLQKSNQNNYAQPSAKYSPASLQSYQNLQGKPYSGSNQASSYKPSKQVRLTNNFKYTQISNSPYDFLFCIKNSNSPFRIPLHQNQEIRTTHCQALTHLNLMEVLSFTKVS